MGGNNSSRIGAKNTLADIPLLSHQKSNPVRATFFEKFTMPERMSDRVLGIFAKEPIAGRSKTRLAQSTSPAWAQRVAQACVEDSLDRFAEAPAKRVIAYAPDSADGYFSPWAHAGYELFRQGEGDLGQRLRNFFVCQWTRGVERVVVVGADSPTLPLACIELAFQTLETCDVVIGPAFDGGYYLIGSVAKDLPIFDDIPWSTSSVLEKTVERLRCCGGRLHLLPPWYDIDTLDDWTMLRGHVLAMRQAGIDPGVPRVERLIRNSGEFV